MPVYHPNDYEHVIARIRNKISDAGIELGNVLTEKDIAKFEKQYGVELPSGYRMFLKEVGDGCDHMIDAARLNRLQELDRTTLSGSFGLDREWIWEEDERDEKVLEKLIDTTVYRGNVELIDLGDGMSYNLIVNGNCRGEVWCFSDVGVQPCCERQDFLGWFELWLDNRDEVDYFQDYNG